VTELVVELWSELGLEVELWEERAGSRPSTLVRTESELT
jgi:hypothetical protein